LAMIPVVALTVTAYLLGAAIWKNTCGPEAIACGFGQGLFLAFFVGVLSPYFMLRLFRTGRAKLVAGVATIISLLGIFPIILVWNAPGGVQLLAVTLWIMLVSAATNYIASKSKFRK